MPKIERTDHNSYAVASDGSARSVQAPVAGVFVAVPGLDQTVPMEYQTFDLSEWANEYFRITAFGNDVLYVFGQSESDTMVGLPSSTPGAGDFRAVTTPLVPDVIFQCTSDRVLIPREYPILILKSTEPEATNVATVRIRRA